MMLTQQEAAAHVEFFAEADLQLAPRKTCEELTPGSSGWAGFTVF